MFPPPDAPGTWTIAQLEAFVAQGERKIAAATATDAHFEVIAPTADTLPDLDED